jgi:hypothetical protein
MPCASGGVPLAVDLWAVRGLAALRDMDTVHPDCERLHSTSYTRAENMGSIRGDDAGPVLPDATFF